MAWAMVNSAPAFSVLLGNGDGTFQEPLLSPLDTIAAGIAVNDFNLDSKSDIAISLVNSNQQTASLLVFISNGDGTFQSAKNSTLPAGGDGLLASGDFNKDGRPDLVIDGPDGYNILLGKGDGTFQSPLKVAVGDNFSPAGVQVVDLDRDGALDLVGYSTYFLHSLDPEGARSLSAHLGVFIANNDGTFKPEQIIATSSWSKSNVFAPPVGDLISPPNVGDFDGDETLDLLFLRTTYVTLFHTTVSANLMPGNGDGTFLESSSVNISSSPTAVADLNGDGRYDLLLLQGDSLAVYLNSGPSVYSLTVTVAGEGSGSVSSNPAGINCESSGGTCSTGHISPGTVYALTASPSGSSSFAGWGGACTGTDPNACTVTVDTNQSVTVTFNVSPDFAVKPSAQSLTVSRGGQASDMLTFPAQGSFSGTIALTCSVSGPAPMPTCGISPNSINPGSNATLTVDASALSAMALPDIPWPTRSVYELCLALAVFAFLLAATLEQRRYRAWLLTATALVLSVFAGACGGGNSGPPPPRNFTVIVTATSGTIQHSTTISVTIN